MIKIGNNGILVQNSGLQSILLLPHMNIQHSAGSFAALAMRSRQVDFFPE